MNFERKAGSSQINARLRAKLFAVGTVLVKEVILVHMETHYLFTLTNGIRVVYQRIPSTKIFHAGIFLDVGSRDESLDNQGIAHFWEHMAFKGTQKRNSFQIINSIDSVGGELNAFTEKERIVFYASVRDQFAERAMDVLSDITFKSVFPAAQIDRERGVILEEMSMYLDTPDDSLQDEFEALIYKDHPLGMNILGRTETITSFKRKDFISFLSDTIDTSRIVFSCVGNFDEHYIERLARKYLEIKKSVRNVKRKKASVYKPRHKELKQPVKQARCAIGRDAYTTYHENRIPFFMLVNMLGGPGMNSRLNLSLREKNGYVYSIDAHYVSFSDTGLFGVYFGTEPKQLDKCINLVHAEFTRLMEKRLTTRQLNEAKEQIKGQLAMSEENNLSHMMMMGRSVLDKGRVPSLEEIFTAIQETDATKIQQMSQEMFNPAKLSYLKMIPG